MIIDIIYEHEDFVVLHKPPCLTMHRASQSSHPALFDCENIDSQWHIVHRLDDVTSGCLVLAKTEDAASSFETLFTQKLIQKTYLALSLHKGKRKMGWIKGDMYKRRNGLWLLKNTHENPAITYFFRKSGCNGKRAFWVQPHSGKTHQIRVALKSNSASILGDEQYQGSPADRVYLHAYALQFIWKGENIAVICEPAHGEAFISGAQQGLWQSQYKELLKQWPAVRQPSI